MNITQDKLDIFEQAVLSAGSHSSFEAGVCAMELVAYIADEPFSDHPACVCPVLAAFCRSWNDGLPDDKRHILKPYLLRLIGTAGDGKAGARSWLSLDWLIRVNQLAWLNLAGLRDHANAIANLPPQISHEALLASANARAAARDAAGAAARGAAKTARDVAWDAAWAAGRDPAWDAAWAAAGAAAKTAVGAAARDAAWDAIGAASWAASCDVAWTTAWTTAGAAARGTTWDTVGDAAAAAIAAAGVAIGDALAPTVDRLQISALDLLDRMITVEAAA